jgi:cold shock protein
MQRGTVEFFKSELGYGFLRPDDGGKDVFVHMKAVDRAGLFALLEGSARRIRNCVTERQD